MLESRPVWLLSMTFLFVLRVGSCVCGCCLCVVTLWCSLGVGFPSVVAFFVDEDVWGRVCAPTIFVSPARNGPENGQEWTKEAGKSLKG